jgi:hypothetical protein
MACVVAPLLHTLPITELEVKTTLPPSQKVVAPFAVIVGVTGNGFTTTVVALEVTEQPFILVTVTL